RSIDRDDPVAPPDTRPAGRGDPTITLERARVSIDLGAMLRRSGRTSEARSHLRAGLALAIQCGSSRLAAVAHQELGGTRLRRSSARTLASGLDALTPTERRIAGLAADGLSNPECTGAVAAPAPQPGLALSTASSG